MKFLKHKKKGFTLIEITLVIALILGLIVVLAVSINAYRKGSQKSRCIMNTSTAQKAVRAYSNYIEKRPGGGYSKYDSAPSSMTYTSGYYDHVVYTHPTAGVYDKYYYNDQVPGYPQLDGVYSKQVKLSSEDYAKLWAGSMESALVPSYIPEKFDCPSDSEYVGWGNAYIPAMGELALQCPKAVSEGHVPKDYTGW